MKADFLDEVVVFPSLEYFLGNVLAETVSDIWGEYYHSEDNVSSFCNLKTLKVYQFQKLETVIPPAMLNRMRNLESIHIRDCTSLRNVFPPCIARDLIRFKSMVVSHCGVMTEIIGADEQEINDGIVFPELTVLQLEYLPKLTSFWCYQTRGDNNYRVEFPNLVNLELKCEEINLGSFGMDYFTCPRLEVLKVGKCGYSTLFTFSALTSLPQLQELEISDCSLLEEIVEGARGGEDSATDKKTITVLQLKSIILTDLPNLKSFISSVNYEFHMPDLKKVNINNCGFSTLFTCSFFRKLHQLAELYVSKCLLLECIVDDVGDDDETSFTDDKTITFSGLADFQLAWLPILKCFSSSSSYAFSMPALSIFLLHHCPRIEFFTFLKTSTSTVRVYTELGIWESTPYLNDYIKQKYKRGSSLSDSAIVLKS
ncbi:hypothetical protein POM88_037347 [Heracleum sosnowskyi]|uniref:YTH domain-containing protein n=1 Tax=Heracleum sosnowskyi TaxID=360622 RepID=A0AAD8HQ28_9APIA|nr:hypothetical protein POM88_037347 [Heracleum sosnowskyi]